MKIGIISDVHGNVKAARSLIKRYKKEQVDFIVYNGDLNVLGDRKEMIKVLRPAITAKCPVVVFPGNHEASKEYRATMRAFKKYKHIINCEKKSKLKLLRTTFVILPGSLVGAPRYSYRVFANKREERKFRKSDYKSYMSMPLVPYLVSELLKIQSPILLSHGSMKFRGKYGLDRAIFGRVTRDFLIDGNGIGIYEKGRFFLLKKAKQLKRKGAPIKIMSENVGNEALTRYVKRQNIKFGISGDIHEAGKRGCTRSGRPVKLHTWSKELFYNPGAAAEGRGGILIIENNKAKYKNVRV